MDFVKAFFIHESSRERLYFTIAGVMAWFKVFLVQPEVIEAITCLMEYTGEAVAIKVVICFQEIIGEATVINAVIDSTEFTNEPMATETVTCLVGLTSGSKAIIYFKEFTDRLLAVDLTVD